MGAEGGHDCPAPTPSLRLVHPRLGGPDPWHTPTPLSHSQLDQGKMPDPGQADGCGSWEVGAGARAFTA